jgi:hypothetical protein
MKGCRKTFEEISNISHIPEVELSKGYDMVFEQFRTTIK